MWDYFSVLSDWIVLQLVILILVFLSFVSTHSCHTLNIVFKHPVALIYSSFTHYTSVHSATRLLSPSPSHYTTPYDGRIQPKHVVRRSRGR
jgi:hypothetical protein